MRTGIWSSRLRSGSAHWDLELAVGVWQCPLGSGARGGGPAVPTGIWTARRRRRVRRRRRRRRRRALLKSSNPHLAGGEKKHIFCKRSSRSNRHFRPGFPRHLLVFHGFPHVQCITQAPQLEHHRTQQDRQRRRRQQHLPLALPQLRPRQRPKPLPGSQEPRLGRSPAIERLVMMLN